MPTIQHIDITPTWRSVVGILIEVAANGETSRARLEARNELGRMADLADGYAALSIKSEDRRTALELIASPMRPDGTWNRDREACRQLAVEALKR